MLKTLEQIPELALAVLVEPEVGDPVQLDLPDGTVTATWLGTVSNGKELARAMRQMAAIAAAREEVRNREP